MLDCVFNTVYAILIIYLNIGFKCLFKIYLNVCYYFFSFSYTYILQGTVKTHLQYGGTYNPLLQIVHRVCQWKKIENRAMIGENKNESKVSRFLFAHGV